MQSLHQQLPPLLPPPQSQSKFGLSNTNEIDDILKLMTTTVPPTVSKIAATPKVSEIEVHPHKHHVYAGGWQFKLPGRPRMYFELFIIFVCLKLHYFVIFI